MTHAQQVLWEKVERLSFDAPGSRYSFVQRVAHENGWNLTLARRAVDEYRRFAFIAATAGHPVSPSHAVDQVWHQHLQFTRQYWELFCRGTLGFALHHEPGVGRGDERAKFDEWYVQTLASYRELFGTEPPIDIWPSPSFRHESARRSTRIDRRRYWLIRRPLHPWHLAIGATIAVVLAGCASSVAGLGNPFDLPGPEFLIFFVCLAAIFLSLAMITDRLLRSRDSSARTEPKDPSAYALLTGGIPRAAQACVATLYFAKAVEIDAKRGEVRAVACGASGLSATDEAVLDLIRLHDGIKFNALAKKTAEGFDDAIDELVSAGMLLPEDQARQLRLKVWALAAVPILVGLVKICVGLQRDRPVGYLVGLVAVYGIITGILWGRVSYRTRRGTQWLRAKREAFDWRRGGHTPNEISICVGLFGSFAVNELELEPLKVLFPENSGGDSGGGCGGGGGGGCGGCGGH